MSKGEGRVKKRLKAGDRRGRPIGLRPSKRGSVTKVFCPKGQSNESLLKKNLNDLNRVIEEAAQSHLSVSFNDLELFHYRISVGGLSLDSNSLT